jgi:hypothetical protein
MDTIKTEESLATTNEGLSRFIFRRRYHCLDFVWRDKGDREADVGADVQQHIANGLIGNLRYEVSE